MAHVAITLLDATGSLLLCNDALNAGADDVDSPVPCTDDATACSPSQQQPEDSPAAEDASSAESPTSAQDLPLAQAVSPAQHATPAIQQPAESSQHFGLSVYGSGATYQGSTDRPAFSPAVVSVQTRKVTPHFREMQVIDAHHGRKMPCVRSIASQCPPLA